MLSSDYLKLTARDIEVEGNVSVRCNLSYSRIAVKQAEIPLCRSKAAKFRELKIPQPVPGKNMLQCFMDSA